MELVIGKLIHLFEFCFLPRSMEWTATHNVLLCREILVEEFYRPKKGSNERGRIWTQISQNLNSVAAVKFKVDQRMVRKIFDLLIGRFRQQSKEAKASGVSPEQTELGALLEEISERETSRINTRILYQQERRNRSEESRGDTHPGLGKSWYNQRKGK